MRKLKDLDEEIRRAERRLEARRDDLNLNLYVSRVRARRTLSSPQVLIGAVVAGFLLERLGRLKPRRAREQPARSGMSGIVAGLAAAALRSAMSNPSVWQSLRQWWSSRKAATTISATSRPAPPDVVHVPPPRPAAVTPMRSTAVH